MKKLIIFTAIFFAFTISINISNSNANSTLTLKISKIGVQSYGNIQYYYFQTTNGAWGATSCPSATYVLVKSDAASAYREILAVALTAKATNSNVTFLGSCYSSPDYFLADYVIIE